MLCEYCNIRAATIILKQNFDGTSKKVHICSECAATIGVTIEKVDEDSVMDEIDSFFASMFANKGSEDEKVQVTTCDFCGMTLKEIQKSGKVGCANCYNVFSDVVENAIRQIHAATSHCGKIPAKAEGNMGVERKLGELREKLTVAIQKEEYEKAAVIRDEMKELSGKGDDDA